MCEIINKAWELPCEGKRDKLMGCLCLVSALRFLQQNLELFSGLNNRWHLPFLHSPWQETLAVCDFTFQEALTVSVITSTDSMFTCSSVANANPSGKTEFV